MLAKNYFWCEEVSAAEARYLRSLYEFLSLKIRPFGAETFTKIQDVLNSLGMIWAQRGDARKALNFLRRAQIMHLDRSENLRTDERVSSFYTFTLLSLAQAYGNLGQKSLSGKYCVETLARHLAHNFTAGSKFRAPNKNDDAFDVLDWVKNCVGMVEFFKVV